MHDCSEPFGSDLEGWIKTTSFHNLHIFYWWLMNKKNQPNVAGDEWSITSSLSLLSSLDIELSSSCDWLVPNKLQVLPVKSCERIIWGVVGLVDELWFKFCKMEGSQRVEATSSPNSGIQNIQIEIIREQ